MLFHFSLLSGQLEKNVSQLTHPHLWKY